MPESEFDTWAEQYAQELIQKLPTYMRDPRAVHVHAFCRVLGKTLVEMQRKGIQTLVDVSLASAQGGMLDVIGQGRYLPRYPKEGDGQYRRRLIGARQFWEQSGTLEGIQGACESLGYPGAVVVEHYKSTGHLNTEWSVVLRSEEVDWAGHKWGEKNWGEFDWGAGLREEERLRIRGVLETIRPSHTRLVSIVVVLKGRVWGVDPWGGRPWGADTVRF